MTVTKRVDQRFLNGQVLADRSDEQKDDAGRESADRSEARRQRIARERAELIKSVAAEDFSTVKSRVASILNLTRWVVTPEMERSGACGELAAESCLLKHGYAQRGPDDERDLSQIDFPNASGDREEFWGRKLATNEAFARAEDEAFMNHAIGSVAPIFDQYFQGMQHPHASIARQGESLAGGSRNSCGSAPQFGGCTKVRLRTQTLAPRT